MKPIVVRFFEEGEWVTFTAPISVDDQDVLPKPEPTFDAKIGRTYKDSTPGKITLSTPPAGAPNVLFIMIDDSGFGQWSTFGGQIPTPNLDRLAKMGLRYTRFHTTALCSPTRAALLTGRNHHSVSTGVVVDQATGYPGYNSVIPRDAVAIGETLRQNGYDTSWYGKEHNVPQGEASQAGPFHNWPTGPVKGFDYYYGFIGDDTNQWQPNNLFRNTTPIQPFLRHPGWNLITAMADEAIGRIKMLNEVQPDRPFMIYYAPGGTHAPHHPTPEWVKKISDMHLFDKGWNALREQIFANQQKLGVLPADAKLTPWPADLIPTWDKLSDVEKKLFIRQADVYAAYLAYTDYEIGRVIQKVEDMGKLDNTLIIYISGDNGASAEGSLNGTPFEVVPFNNATMSAEQQMPFYDVWGTDKTYPHYAIGWAWAFDTPYKWNKQIPTFFGGTKNGMAISWPARIKEKGGTRWQFHHVIDIVPTLLEVTGIPAPIMVDGVGQKPIEGVSLAYTFDGANANAPSPHRTQYFEMMSVQGLYNDGWMLSAVPIRPPWEVAVAAVADPATAYKFELYELSKDWTQFTDVSAAHPQKMQQMRDLMFGEFAKYQVLPLDGSLSTRFVAPRPSMSAGRKLFTYPGSVDAPIPNGSQPNLTNTSYTVTAEIDVPEGGAEGMLVDLGGRYGGYGLYLLKSKPVFMYNFVGLERTRWEGPQALAPGKHTLVFDFKYDGLGAETLAYNNLSGVGRGGTGTLSADGKVVATTKMAHTTPLTYDLDDTFAVATSAETPLDDADYKVPFPFTGKLTKLTIAVDEPKLTPEDIKKMQEAARKHD